VACAAVKRARQPIDHHGRPKRDRVLKQRDGPTPIGPGDDLGRGDDRRIADGPPQRDRYRIGGEIDMEEFARQDRVGISDIVRRIVLQRRAECQKHAEFDGDDNGEGDEHRFRHRLER
jgi:hypothetical protein